MDSYTRKERAEYNARREGVCERLGITESQYNYFRRIGENLHRIDEWYCNGTKGDPSRYPIEEYAEGQYLADEEAILKKLADYWVRTGDSHMHFYHQSDPRGCSLYISTEPMDASSYDSGSAIY